ncbi:MAG: MG2 domain-containing protein [Flavobacteriales bacterium]|jgi:uncharacterized protein YfaS (alpha-2-macroglobulin family)|nr:MG2 domain-containing protein [Flavobacteriales bacterium]
MSFKKHVFSIIIVILSVLFLGFSCKNKKSTANTNTNNQEMTALNFNFEEDYQNLWDTVAQHENNGLYKSALRTVKEIFQTAQKDENTPQTIKALIYKMKYNSYLEEDDFVKALNELQGIAKTAKFPLKQLVHSIAAETYWRYYQQNQWQINGRSYSEDFKDDDIRTWDLKTLSNKTFEAYLASLSGKDSLQHTTLSDFKAILNYHEETEKFRPTLYDFLASRSLEFFENTQFNLTQPADFFTLNDEVFYEENQAFTELEIVRPKDASNLFYAIKIYQELTIHQSRLGNESGIIETTLKRLSFVNNQTTHPQKEKLYFDALTELTKTYKENDETARVWYKIAQIHSEKGDRYNRTTGEHQLEKKKAMEICNATISKFPESYGAKECRALKLQIEAKSMAFEIEKSQRPNQPIQLVFKHKNINKVFFKLVKVEWDFNFKDRYETLDRLNKLTPVRTWEVAIDNQNDYQEHYSHLNTDGLPYGKYFILSGTHKDFIEEKEAVAYASFWVTDISFSSVRNGHDETELLVVNSETGKVLPNVLVQQYTYDYGRSKRNLKKRSQYKTDSKGKVKVTPHRTNYYSNSYYYYFKNGKDEYFTDNSIYQYGRYKEDEKERIKTTFFTDRAIYRPGQTVYFKGIVIGHYKDKHYIIPKAKKTITLYDVNRQKIADVAVVTNEYGTFSGTFKLPTGAMNGSMSLSDENRQRKYIQVEEYKRPKFEVNFDPIKGSYKLNQTIEVVGNAKAFAGYFLDGATVKYRVVRAARFPYWCWYRWGYNPTSPTVEIKSGVLKTDDNGEFKVDFTALADETVEEKYSPTFSYEVIIDVTDLNGETQSNTAVVNVGYNAMDFSIGIAESFDKNEEQELKINAQNLNGEEVEAQGWVKVTALIEPDRIYRSALLSNPDLKTIAQEDYHSLFPFDEYDRENSIEKLKRGSEVWKQTFDTKNSRVLKLIKNKLTPGRYVLEAETTDEFGTKVIDVKYFTVYDKQGSKIPVKATWWTTDLKLKGEPGEKAAFVIGTSEKELLVTYEIEHRGEIVHSEVMALSDEQRLIELPIEEKHRGNFSVMFTTTKHNRFFQDHKTIAVPYTNKKLDLTFESFRNKLLPGQKEEWKIKIRGAKGDKVAAELLATMYDASLDEFASNSIGLSIYNSYYASTNWTNSCFAKEYSSLDSDDWNPYYSFNPRAFTTLNWFGYSYYQYAFGYRGRKYKRMVKSEANFQDADNEGAELEMADAAPLYSVVEESEVMPAKAVANSPRVGSGLARDESKKEREQDKKVKPSAKPRTNFNETAFFYPQLETNKNGDVIVKFTIPESLTRWKFLALAHTKDLKIGTTQKELITQKELMVVPNAPRFFREGDQMSFSSKVVNLSEGAVQGKVKLELFDALSMKMIDTQLKNVEPVKEVSIAKGKSVVVNWKITIPEGYSAITYKVTAEAGNHTDGEEMAVPVLTNRMLVTESLPLPVKKAGETKFTFEKLISQSNGSATLKNHKVTLEFTSNPAWYAIQALPYLMEYPYECAEQTFSRYYANAIAGHVANSNPKIKRVFDQWSSYDSEAFLSNLEKNQELKALLLEETPWVLNAQDEQERKKRVALLFDLNRMQNEKERTIRKLEKMQLHNGAWPWFNGMRENRYITQHIITGLGHLNQLGVEKNSQKAMTKKAVTYLDNQMQKDYLYIKKHHANYLTKQTISNSTIQYLYARSFYLDLPIKKQHQEAYAYFMSQAKTYWLEFNLYTQGMIALAVKRSGDETIAKKVMASIKERAIYNEEMGMYWKDLSGGYYWYQAPIETQALLIEAFDEVTNDQNSVNEMKVWLLKQKQTTDWKTTKATADACYALLLKGTDMLSETDVPTIKLGGKKVTVSKTEAGTGYFKTSWSGADINPEMGNVSVTKKQNSVAWGALYWQYFEDLDKITPHETPLKLTKKLYIERNSNAGKVLEPITKESPIKIGDKIKVRVVLETDRNLEYVHLKDMRAASFEPTNVISRYKWQDGLGYYESTKDASTNFFMDYVSKGTYVFEYSLIASQEGNFSNGITTIQCMYAPEFTSHSEGIRVEIKP